MKITDSNALKAIFDYWIEDVHTTAKNHGRWDENRNDGEMIALMHSELSEALEAFRKH